jgi:hypothetical protein
MGLGEIRPLLMPVGDALWPTGRVTLAPMNHRFATYRDELGLPDGIDFHSLRRSYVTHLIEDGWDPRFVQDQVGHEHASTTSIYTNPQKLHQTGENVVRASQEVSNTSTCISETPVGRVDSSSGCFSGCTVWQVPPGCNG